MNKLNQGLLTSSMALGVALGAGVQSPTAIAQESLAILEEVIVTARKREEFLQETPVAVTALDAEALKQANIANLGDLVKVVPIDGNKRPVVQGCS